jgi:hypothetical protein
MRRRELGVRRAIVPVDAGEVRREVGLGASKVYVSVPRSSGT